MHDNECIIITLTHVHIATYVVHIFFFMFIGLSKIAITFIPLLGVPMGLLRPCMPPMLSSIINLGCKSWNDHGNIGILQRMVGVITTVYAAHAVVATCVFLITVVLIYPTEVKLILVEAMKRLRRFLFFEKLCTYLNFQFF